MAEKRSRKKPKKHLNIRRLLTALFAVIIVAVAIFAGSSIYEKQARANWIKKETNQFQAKQKAGITIDFGNGKSFNIPTPYQPIEKSTISLGKSPKLALRPEVNQEIQQNIAQLNLNAGAKAPEGPELAYNQSSKQFDVAKATPGTTVDLPALTAATQKQVAAANATTYSLDLKNYLTKAQNPASMAQMQAKAAIYNGVSGTLFTLSNSEAGETANVTTADIATAIEPNGSVNAATLTTFVTNTLAPKFNTLTKDVYVKDPETGHIYKFLNNQAYGYYMNVKQTVADMTTALTQAKAPSTLKVNVPLTPTFGTKLEGFTPDNPIQSTYVWVNTDEQEAWLYVDGKLVSQSPTLTGYYDKGQATVSGFTTVDYKQASVTMTGYEPQMNGGAGGTYSLPIQNVEWLLFRPFDSPTTGNHPEPYETGIAIHQSETADGAGSKPDAWFTQYHGNIKAAPIGTSSNGCIGLPASTAPIFYQQLSSGFPVIIHGTVYDSAPGTYDKPVDNGVLVK